MRSFAVAMAMVAACVTAGAGCGKVRGLVDAGPGSGSDIDASVAIDAAPDCATRACSGTADGCCPTACNGASDADCLAVCDNAVIEPGELCDPLTSCPSACPQIGCLLRTLDQPGTCKAACVNGATQSACITGAADGCCPPGCNSNDDLDCAATCDNGVIEAGETCDPLSSCPSACPQQQCGLYTLFDAGTCRAQCVLTSTQSACVDGDGCCPGGCNANNDSDCTPVCGNGAIENGETCDPPGSCPVCSEAYTCYQEAGDASTCDVVCHLPIDKCGIDGDSCCAFDGSGGCDSGTDKECEGGGWKFVQLKIPYDFSKGCTTHRLGGFVGGGSYLFTTCVPQNAATGTGDPVIKRILDSNQIDYPTNDDCTDKTALPLAAGWTCKTSVGSHAASCASPSPGGFILTKQPAYIDVTVCPGAGGGGATPMYIWFNATAQPNDG